MTRTITLRVNGKEHTVEVPVQRLLIDCLRYDLGLTGTKEGCSVGVCGACTVLMDGQMIVHVSRSPYSQTVQNCAPSKAWPRRMAR